MKQALKILVIAGVVMVVLFGVAAFALLHRFKRDAAGIQEMQAVRNKEVERINALPELRGALVQGGLVRTPFSRRDVPAYALIQGRLLQLSGPSGGRSSGPGDGPTYRYEDDVVLVGGPNLMISIAGTLYPFTPDSVILSGSTGHGMEGEEFRSNEVWTLFDPEKKQDELAVRGLKGRSGLLDRYIAKGGRVGDPEVDLQERLFSVGDTISFKGRIEGGRIVPLF